MIRVLPKYEQKNYINNRDIIAIDCTSHNPAHRTDLSPFYLKPVIPCDGIIAKNVENAWQYSKVYPCFVDNDENPGKNYFDWRNKGFNKTCADRHPMGRQTPLYALWKNPDGEYEKLGYIESRRRIYVPLYATAVVKTSTYAWMKAMHNAGKDIVLFDFDAYDHIAKGMTYEDVLNNTKLRMGHAFVLAMLLDGYLEAESINQ